MSAYMLNTENCKIKKVMFIVSSLTSGGAERVISELSNNFSERGIEVSILLISHNAVAYDLNPNIKLILLKKKMEGVKGLLAVVRRCVLIKRYVKRLNPDIVFSFLSIVNIYTCISLGWSHNKLIVSERNDPERDPTSVMKRKVRNYVYNYADGYVFQTELAKNYFPTCIQEKSVVIPNPLKNGLPEASISEREKRIVAIGRLEEQKNYSLLIRAFAELNKDYPDHTLDIFGEGSQRESLEMLAKELGLLPHVNFRGVVRNVHEIIKGASMFVLTSDYEGMPNALMEAMAIGLPCVSSDCPCGGPAALINDSENGMLFPVGDQTALYACMKEILDDRYLLEKLSKNAVGIKDTHQLSLIADQWLSFAEEIRNRG